MRARAGSGATTSSRDNTPMHAAERCGPLRYPLLAVVVADVCQRSNGSRRYCTVRENPSRTPVAKEKGTAHLRCLRRGFHRRQGSGFEGC